MTDIGISAVTAATRTRIFVNNQKSDTEVVWYADGNKLMIYWRKPSEWASKLYEWVDGSGQVDSVLTLYEIREGEVTMGTGMRVWVRECLCGLCVH